MPAPTAPSHTWKFIRTGGLDQATLETGADLAALRTLDPKLWVALACPVQGLEFDEKTLALIDTDRDGRVRVPEIIAAAEWALARLKNPDALPRGGPALPLTAIDDQLPEGRALLASARQILRSLGKPEAAQITVADTVDTAKIFQKTLFNGDGVIPADAATDAPTKQVVLDIIATLGGKPDRSGLPGVDQATADRFFSEAAAFADWVTQGEQAADKLPLGELTAEAFAALNAVRTKVDDYFNRCRLAAFDTRATSHLNRAEQDFATLAAHDLSTLGDDIASLPLARVEAGRPLPLAAGVNPAWATALATLQTDVVAPVFNDEKRALTESEWSDLKAKFTAYESWLSAKAGGAVEKLGIARVREICAGRSRETLNALLAQDLALAPEMAAIENVERLARYYRDLGRLLRNFVNFADFYAPDRASVFQAGTLYLDSRHCELCLRVDDPAAHSVLATMSRCYVAYCELRRPGETMKIAAVFSNGDSDFLMVGRNGLFIDCKGRDWDATVVKVIDNPISIHQAFWSPYKKFVRLIEEQVAKRAAAAESASDAKLATAASSAANADKSEAKPAPKKIDVGTVAALGVAVGAIGGALGAIATGLAALAWWQLPLVLVALLLVISLPSVLIAWLKLRQRTLGPLLEANGWAINGRIRINLPLGTSFTKLARLPANARRSLDDPFEDKQAVSLRRRIIGIAILITLLAGAIWVRLDHGRDGKYFWERSSAAPKPAAAAPVAPVPPPAPEKK